MKILSETEIEKMAKEFSLILTDIINIGLKDEYSIPINVSKIDKKIDMEISLFSNLEGVYCTSEDFVLLVNKYLHRFECFLMEAVFEVVVNIRLYDFKMCVKLFQNIDKSNGSDAILFNEISISNEKLENYNKKEYFESPNEKYNYRNSDTFLGYVSSLDTLKDSKNEYNDVPKDKIDFYSGSKPENSSLLKKVNLREEKLKKPFIQNTNEIIQNRPFVCKFVGCSSAFKRLEHLKRHNRIHTGEKPFKCHFPGCYKKFARSDNLSQHLKIHNMHSIGKRNKYKF